MADSFQKVEWIKNEPYVDDSGIYVPVNEYTQKGYSATYRMVMSADVFKEAFRKYILEDTSSDRCFRHE